MSTPKCKTCGTPMGALGFTCRCGMPPLAAQDEQSVRAARLDGALALLMFLRDTPDETGCIDGAQCAALLAEREELRWLVQNATAYQHNHGPCDCEWCQRRKAVMAGGFNVKDKLPVELGPFTRLLPVWVTMITDPEFRGPYVKYEDYKRLAQQREEFRTTILALLGVIDRLAEQQAMPDDFWKETADAARKLVKDSI